MNYHMIYILHGTCKYDIGNNYHVLLKQLVKTKIPVVKLPSTYNFNQYLISKK